MEEVDKYEASDLILQFINRKEHSDNLFDTETLRRELFPQAEGEPLNI
jgi:hypothetical protein